MESARTSSPGRLNGLPHSRVIFGVHLQRLLTVCRQVHVSLDLALGSEHIRFPLLPAHFLAVSMNKDQVVGNLKQAAGKIQEKAGELIDSPTQQAKGLAKQAEGTAQEKMGDLKEAVNDAKKRL